MGTVYLIGAGPGDPELLTIKAARLLSRAEIVYHDSLVSQQVLQLVSPTAHIIDVGKRCGHKLLTQEEINSLLVCAASKHEIVVRLKGGDPLVFGRAGEEIGALRDAGVAFEIVPGITAALASAAAAKISLTDRRAASQILFATFSRGTERAGVDWSAITSETTLVLYMPGPDYSEVARRLREAGLPLDLPCVVVSQASQQGQQVCATTIAALAYQEKLPAPALMIVGRVASSHMEELEGLPWREEAGLHAVLQAAIS